MHHLSRQAGGKYRSREYAMMLSSHPPRAPTASAGREAFRPDLFSCKLSD